MTSLSRPQTKSLAGVLRWVDREMAKLVLTLVPGPAPARRPRRATGTLRKAV